VGVYNKGDCGSEIVTCLRSELSLDEKFLEVKNFPVKKKVRKRVRQMTFECQRNRYVMTVSDSDQ
jgi:hypothetical protein